MKLKGRRFQTLDEIQAESQMIYGVLHTPYIIIIIIITTTTTTATAFNI